MHPGAEVVENFYAVQRRFYAGEDVAAELRTLLAEDVVWHIPGRSAVAGEYRGVDEVLAYFAKRRDRARGSFHITPRGTLADDQRVIHFADGDALIDGRRHYWRTLGIFHLDDRRIVECWLLPFDQYEFDEIWT
jgi:ketosteroid isomerase-like protein